MRCEQVDPADADRRLRNLVFQAWQQERCEAYEDTLKLTGLIDFFLPYFPLERVHIRELLERGLKQRSSQLLADKAVSLAWSEVVLTFLLSRVEFDGLYPLEGAKQVEAILTRYTARILRKCKQGAAPKRSRHVLMLAVAKEGKELWGQVVATAA